MIYISIHNGDRLSSTLTANEFITKYNDNRTYIKCNFIDIQGKKSSGYIMKHNINYIYNEK